MENNSLNFVEQLSDILSEPEETDDNMHSKIANTIFPSEIRESLIFIQITLNSDIVNWLMS
jgi:hypothetical protein